MSIILAARTIGVFEIDALLSENHQSQSTITDNPIESGSSRSDHVYNEPKRVTLTFANDRAADSYSTLLSVQDNAESFSIVTGLRVYPNMMIESISAIRRNGSDKILDATVQLKELIVTGTRTIQVGQNTESIGTATNNSTADRVASTLERGDSAVQQIPEADQAEIIGSIQ